MEAVVEAALEAVWLTFSAHPVFMGSWELLIESTKKTEQDHHPIRSRKGYPLLISECPASSPFLSTPLLRMKRLNI